MKNVHHAHDSDGVTDALIRARIAARDVLLERLVRERDVILEHELDVALTLDPGGGAGRAPETSRGPVLRRGLEEITFSE